MVLLDARKVSVGAMTDAFKIDEERETGWFDLTRLPATREVILPPEVKRRALIAGLVGVFGLVIAAALFWFVDGLDEVKIVLKWQENALFGVAYISAIVGALALLRTYTELAGWDRRRLVTVGEGYVEITRWPIIGARKFNHVPLADYTGVMKNFENYGKHGVRYSIGLKHDNLRLGELLYSSRSAVEWDEKWRHYAGILHLPAIDEGHRPKDADVDGMPAIRVRSGALFTLNAGVLPVAILHEAEPWLRLSGFVTGLGMGGLFGFMLWASYSTTKPIPKDWKDIAVMLLILAVAIWSFAIAIRSHFGYRTFIIDRNQVAGTRRRLFSLERWTEPLSTFRGVSRSAGKEVMIRDGRSEKIMRYRVDLVHREPHKSVTLYRASHDQDIPTKLRHYSDWLGVPIIGEGPL